MPGPKTEQLVIRVTPDLSAALKDRASTEERSMAQIVRFALRAYLDDKSAPAAIT
jgi:hypothetical protein